VQIREQNRKLQESPDVVSTAQSPEVMRMMNKDQGWEIAEAETMSAQDLFVLNQYIYYSDACILARIWRRLPEGLAP
jgi:hypothetical protein